jgi:hypothetical protein
MQRKVRKSSTFILKLDILNFSGDVIIYDSDQDKLFSLNFTTKAVLHSLLENVGNIDTMDFGKL